MKCLVGGVLEPILLSFRSSLYSREQATVDPFYGLRTYGPYKPVNVEIKHIIPRDWLGYLKENILDILENQIENILSSFLDPAGKRVTIHREYVGTLKPLIEKSSSDNNCLEDLKEIIKENKDAVILFPLPINIIGKAVADRIYSRMKALGLSIGSISQAYSDVRTLNVITKLVKQYIQGRARIAFNAILLNLSLNIFAKAGGIPWALYNESSYRVVIGLSWSLKRETEATTGPTMKCYGVVHTFSNIGVWESLNAFVSQSSDRSIKEALKETLSEILDIRHSSGGVLIMLREHIERSIIRDIARECEQKGYFVDIVRISDALPARFYSIKIPDRTAPRGLYAIISKKEAFLVTTGYSLRPKIRPMGVPVPILINLLYTSNSGWKDSLLRVIQNIYSLTAMNWRTFWGALRLPAPLHYSKLVSKFFTILTSEDIKRSFAKIGDYLHRPKNESIRNRPWFL